VKVVDRNCPFEELAKIVRKKMIHDNAKEDYGQMKFKEMRITEVCLK
jgi:hypothetical protein